MLFCVDMKEAIPPNAPDPRGKEVDLRIFVDPDYAGDKITRLSRTGYIIFLKMLQLLGCPRSKQLLELQCLEQNFL